MPVHEMVAPEPGLEALLLEVALDLDDILGEERSRVLAAAAGAEGAGPPFVVADVHAARLQDLHDLVQEIEEDPVRLGIGRAVRVGPGHVGVLGHVTPRRRDVVGVAQGLHLRDHLEPEVGRPPREPPQVVLLHERPAAHAHVKRGREAVGRAQGDAFPELVDGLSVGVPLGHRASPAHTDLGMRVVAQPATHLEDDAVELVPQQEVAQVAAGERELVAGGHEEMHEAQGEERPVANLGLAHDHALLAPGTDELDEGRHAVEGPPVVAPRHQGARLADVQGIALGLLGNRGRRLLRGRGHHSV